MANITKEQLIKENKIISKILIDIIGPRKLIIELLSEFKGKKHIGNLKMSWYSVQGKFNSKDLTILLKKDMSHKNFTQTHEKISFFIQLANKIMGKIR